jgi:cellulose synthase/poly-beta-1,6-N-acetylglucosamine synthase-like glycosyltransferase
MPELLHLLTLSIAGLFVNGVVLVTLGHRIKIGHWLFSLAYLAAVLLLTRVLIEHVSAVRIEDATLWAAFFAGMVVIACSDSWNAPGQVCFTMVILCGLTYLGYIGYVSLYSSLGPLSLFFSCILLILIVAAILLMVAHTFEVVDVLCRIRWRRVFTPQPTEDYFPKVSLHVPAYNEPPEMVIDTLNALARLDYPNYEVIMIDDNSTDEALWRPVEAHCRKLGFKFFHLENWPGFKSGALNYALTQVAADSEIIGVIDSDYIVEPDYLKDLVGFFRNGNIAFVQTPQDYRAFDAKDRYELACYQAYKYFFKLSMVSRNERNSIIFTGTMGLIQRLVLESVGGWDEWCITEDAEIALKILNMGYESIYIDKTYGRGVMPLNFEGLKKQRFRWAFGGMQVLRLHWKKLLPLVNLLDSDNKLSFAQKYDYWAGGLQWLNDPLTFIFTVVLIVSSVTFSITHSVFLQPVAGAILFVPFIFIIFGLLRMLWALKVRQKCTLLEAYRAFLVLLGLTWVVTMACALGLTRKEGQFLRTPKQKDHQSLIGSLRVVGKESLFSTSCVACIGLVQVEAPLTATTALLSGLLLWQGYIYGAAFVVNRWGLQSLAHGDPLMLRSSRTTGERFRGMVTDARATVLVSGGILSIVLLYYFAVEYAPDTEVVFRTNPLQQPFIHHHLINNPPSVQVKSRIFLEEHSALTKDIDQVLKLWDPNGVLRDANFTPNDQSDDKVWRGLAQIRQRYQEEYRQRDYIRLKHKDIATILEKDSAVVVNDLAADFIMDGKEQKVYLSGDDRWDLRLINGQWKIVSLTVNLTPR